MTSKLVLHPKVVKQLDVILQNPPHALLITGPPGIGKSTIARHIAATLMQTPNDAIVHHPFIHLITSIDGKAIGIETVRELEQVLSLKVPNHNVVNRIIVIDGAQALTIEAQNALLNTLEEPPTGTMLVLTSVQPADLLPTIQSRLQTLDVLSPTNEQLEQALLEHGIKAAELPRVMALAGSLPGLAFALSDGDETHPLVQATTLARQLLQQSVFERLTSVDKLAKNKVLADDVLYVLLHMARTALVTGKAAKRWQQVLAVTYQGQKSLAGGSQPKLVLTDLMLNL